MKWLVGWGIVFVLSWGLGAIVCGITLWLKHYKAAKIAALIFFGLPVMGVTADLINEKWILYKFEQAKKEVVRLCAKEGGDKIYRIVENVQGVFQMRVRENAITSKRGGLSDQYGMVDPYGWAVGDWHEVDSMVGAASVRQVVKFKNVKGKDVQGETNMPRGKQGYWFVEQYRQDNSLADYPYRRTYLVRIHDEDEQFPNDESQPSFVVKQSEVAELQSRYGYMTEDMTTDDMRDNWIGAGRISIIDLNTKEVLAVRNGYYRASGDLLPPGAFRWTASGAFMQNRVCPSNESLIQFLHSVLKPVRGFPSSEQLSLIAKE